MRSSSTATFRKLKTCPPAESLLRFVRGGGAHDERVTPHVAACDFCAAEAQLLGLLPAREEGLRRVRAEIPAHLRLLAESLLMLPSQNRARFAESLQEVGRMTLTDA